MNTHSVEYAAWVIDEMVNDADFIERFREMDAVDELMSSCPTWDLDFDPIFESHQEMRSIWNS